MKQEQVKEHFAWLREAGFSKVACQWQLYNFAITTAEKKSRAWESILK